MGKFGNSSKVIDAEKRQEIIKLLSEGYKHFIESKRQMAICKELNTKAMMMIIENNLLEEFSNKEIPELLNIIMIEIKEDFKDDSTKG